VVNRALYQTESVFAGGPGATAAARRDRLIRLVARRPDGRPCRGFSISYQVLPAQPLALRSWGVSVGRAKGRPMRVLIVVALLLGAAGLTLGVVSILEEDDKESQELALALTVEEGDFKVNDVAPRATSEEDISS
jgi:hypothetical protein